MELRHLRYFVAVAEELHFRRAAERLYVAQPAVSEQIRKLEAELGVRLFDRNQRHVALTVAGRALLDEARRVLHQAEIAQMAARNAESRAVTSLRVGHPPDLLPNSVIRAMRVMGTADGRAEVRLETGPSLRLVDELRAERLDAVVVGLPTSTHSLRVTRVGEQRAVLALPVTHRAAVAEAVSLRRLSPERLIVLPPDTNPAFHNAIVAACRDAGISPKLVPVSEPRIEHALFAVAAGAGMALLLESAAERHMAPGVRFVALDDVGPAFESAVLTRSGNEDLAVAAFLRAIADGTRAPAPAMALAA